MTATAHALIGAAIAAKIVNPFLAIPLAIISHFALDLIPHWDEGLNHRKKTIMRYRVEAAIDVLLGFALAFILFGSKVNPTYLFIMIIASELPDWIESPYVFLGNKFPPFYWAYQLSHKVQTRMQLPWGLVTQIVVVVPLVFLALK